MTNKEHLISETRIHYSLSKELSTKFVDIYHKMQFSCFISQMGDYDAPNERVEAKKEFMKEFKKLINSVDDFTSFSLMEVFADLDNHNFGVGKLYWSVFHTMNENYSE